MFQSLLQYIKAHKWQYLSVVLALIIYDVTLVLPTKLIESLIDQMTDGRLTWSGLWWLIGSLVIVTLLSYVLAYVWHLYLFRGSIAYKFDIQEISFKKLIKMRRPFYEKFRSGDMLTRFSSDAESLESMIGYGTMVLLYGGGLIAFILPTMMTISWQITLLALVPICLLTVSFYMIGRRQENLVEEKRDAVANLNNEVLEVIEGIRVTRAYHKKSEQAHIFKEKAESVAHLGNQVTAYQSLYLPLTKLLVGLSTVIILWFGARGLQDGSMTLGQIIALQLYVLSLLEPFMMMSDLILVYQSGKTSFGKIQELIETNDDLELDGKLVLREFEQLQMQDYSFTYPQSSRPSLIDVSFELTAGQTLGIVGKTGSGKTTLVRQLLRQYPLGEGGFDLNNHPIGAYQRRSVTSQVAYVPQEHILFSKSLEANVRLGKSDASTNEVLEAIEMAAFSSDLAKMSDGLETMIGERGVSISGGQKQRIALARAFLRDAAILILDDSLSAVDAKTERAIIRQLQEGRKDRTNIIVTHRLSAVHHADYVLVLDEGRIVEEGRPEELLAQEGWYFEQYQRQQAQEASGEEE